ncbi:Aste57867_20730 [Aphanomyces stellatus]|uniref:Aste57867_20730 protein n=1 Tax=Aphanomyces stellatus TaxID=120398 RepID=A0A485LGX4_9STRA|nr:hypothetical protein As57867_020662 [Aphanomyces stellatus]VFT97410.1 Aste57867_20730 [Aphanomyces stellatus]
MHFLYVLSTVVAVVAAGPANPWTEYLALPQITSIVTPVITGGGHYLEVKYNGNNDSKLFEIAADLTLDGLQLPEGVAEFAFTGMHLKTLPSGFKWPASLHAVDLSYNDLVTIPTNAPWPSMLKSLNVHANKILDCCASLPHALTDLDFGDNQLRSLRGCMFPPTLETLTLSGNPLKSLADNQVWPPNLKTLSLSNAQLSQVPKQLPKTLQQFHFASNNLKQFPTQLPASIGFLNLGGNKITQLPQVIGYPKLFNLDLSHNQLQSLPEDFTLPSEMAFLSLSHNLLRTLPTNSKWITQVDRALYLDSNKLTALPRDVAFPIALVVSDNQITNLENLALPCDFDIQNNPLRVVSRVTMACDRSYWSTMGDATLSSFVLEKPVFDQLTALLKGAYYYLYWKTDDASVLKGCNAEGGTIQKLKGNISVCVVE